MPRLLELPNKILEQIMRFFLPNNIDNLSVCCKNFYILSAKNFAKHKEMKLQYYCASSIFSEWHPIFIVRSLFQKPDIAVYVGTLEIWSYSSARQPEISEKPTNTCNDLQNTLSAILYSFSCLTAKEKETCMEGLLFVRQSPALALRAFILSYLEKMEIRVGWSTY